MDRRSFLQQAAVTAAAFVFPRAAFAAIGGDGTLLDLAEAARFREKYPPELNSVCDLDVYERATPDALEYLANQGYGEFVYIGLAELDRNNARILAKWNPALIFSNLKYLDTEVAAILSDATNSLAFGKLVVSPEVARELARANGLLDLRMDSISLDVANELVRHPHELILHSRMSPSEQVLRVLCGHAGYRITMYLECQPDNQGKRIIIFRQTKRYSESCHPRPPSNAFS